jgi:hypothetical protein
MACFLCFTSVFGMMDNKLTLGNPFSSLSYRSSFPPSTTDNNNSSQSVPSSVPTPVLKNDREFILAKIGRNNRRNPAYKCLLCGCFLSRVKGTTHSCNMCRTCFTVIVRGKTPYLAMSTKSSSKKYRLTNCECSECLSHDVYFVGKARYGIVRCICGNCGISGLCRPSQNPATNAWLVGWDELQQHTQSNPTSKLALYKLRDSTK